MERAGKVQVLLFLTGVGVFITKWGLESVFIEDPDIYAVGRFQMIASIYGVTALYALWKMFKPPWMHLPEYSKSKYHPGAGFHESWWYLKKKKK